MTDADFDAELVAHAHGRTPDLDAMWPPAQCDDALADEWLAILTNRTPL